MLKRLVVNPTQPLGIKIGGDCKVAQLAEGQCKAGGIVVGDLVTSVDGQSMEGKTDTDITQVT